MRVNCTDCLLCMRQRNSFNSLRLRGQQEMEHKHGKGSKCVGEKIPAAPYRWSRMCGCVLVRGCVHVFLSASVCVSPALQDTPATVWIRHCDTWLAVSLLEARLHRHLRDLQHYKMESDQAEQPEGVAAQMWRICTLAMNLLLQV